MRITVLALDPLGRDDPYATAAPLSQVAAHACRLDTAPAGICCGASFRPRAVVSHRVNTLRGMGPLEEIIPTPSKVAEWRSAVAEVEHALVSYRLRVRDLRPTSSLARNFTESSSAMIPCAPLNFGSAFPAGTDSRNCDANTGHSGFVE